MRVSRLAYGECGDELGDIRFSLLIVPCLVSSGQFFGLFFCAHWWQRVYICTPLTVSLGYLPGCLWVRPKC